MADEAKIGTPWSDDDLDATCTVRYRVEGSASWRTGKWSAMTASLRLAACSISS